MSRKRKLFKIAAVPVVLLAVAACVHASMMAATPKPPASEFGYGPRASRQGTIKATIEDSASFNKGKMLKPIVVRVTAANGSPIDGLQLAVDGGMPQHGHGLPTKPRVTKNLGDGRYQIEGLKFNMGGWWELKLITSGSATDSVVFNLSL
jgi:hypothetical protein